MGNLKIICRYLRLVYANERELRGEYRGEVGEPTGKPF